MNQVNEKLKCLIKNQTAVPQGHVKNNLGGVIDVWPYLKMVQKVPSSSA